MKEAERLERLLLILAYAYMIIVLLGEICIKRYKMSYWSSVVTNEKEQASAFVVARLCLIK